MQFRLQTLLWIVLVLCVVFAWRRDRTRMKETIAEAEARVKARQEQLELDALRLQGSILRYDRDRERLHGEMLKLASTTEGGFSPAPAEDRLLMSGREAEDLTEAVEYLKAKLIADELEPVAELLNEQMVKDAIRSAVATNDARMHIIAKEWPTYPAAWEGFRAEFLEVAENGSWTGCSFDFSYVPTNTWVRRWYRGRD